MQPDQALTVLHFLLPTIEREHATTVRVLSAVPADRGDYKPDPKCYGALDLAWHIASSEQYFMTGAAAGEFPKGITRPESAKTPAAIVDWYKEQFANNLARVKQMSGADLVRVVNFHDKFQFPAIAFLQLMMNHSIHHRGQLSAYLRPMGARVPSIYGPSGDEDILTASEATA